ncbi:MAG: PH domain-containing protein [Flavobacteriaceae bacterium]|nr:PH domain-containing protein [Flavobacteriaceae bacterium]
MKKATDTLYTASPSMFKNHPLFFILCILLIPYLVGLLLLAIWWLQCKSTFLTITSQTVTLRKGLLSKHINEIRHRDIKNIQIHQSLLDRIFRVGRIGLSTAGQSDIEILVSGLPEPYRIKTLLESSIVN